MFKLISERNRPNVVHSKKYEYKDFQITLEIDPDGENYTIVGKDTYNEIELLKLKDQLTSIHITNGNFYNINKAKKFVRQISDAIEIKEYLDENIEELLK